MIPHPWSRSSPRWRRNTRWTPLLLSQREFQRALSKERSRVDRCGGQFGVIILRLSSLRALRRQTTKLAKILRQRLRDTDEIGHLGPGRVGVMLPLSGAQAVELVMPDLLKRLKSAGIQAEAEGFCYPDKPGPTDHSSQDSDSHLGEPAPSPQADVGSASLPQALLATPYPIWKRTLDIAGASIGLTFSAPLILALGAVVKITSPGGALFMQTRTGYLGREFTIYKLRTMQDGAEGQRAQLLEMNERDGPAFKLRSDPRVTSIGRFLRATALDELPQLYNVLIGDMALVGPRPLPCFEAEECQPWQRQRELIKPGLTCYWQIRKSEQIPFTQWMRLDLAYLRRQSLAVDLRLVVQTFASIIKGRVGH